MERTRGGMRLRCLGFWLNCCLLAGCLGLWLACGHLDGAWGSGSLGGHLDGAWGSGSLGGHLDGAWGSGSVYLEKVPAFFEFAGTFFTQSQSRPTETLFTAQSGLTRELLTPKFHIDPRTSLLALTREQVY